MTRSISVIGNVQLDVLAHDVRRLPQPGGDEVIEHIAVRPAGAAGNVALALAALRVQHRLFGAVGDDQAGRWVAQELERLGVGGDVAVVAGEETGISIALEAPDRERAFLTAHGVLSRYGFDDVSTDATDADLVLLTGYFSLPGLRGEGVRRLLERTVEGHALNLFDTGWDPDDWAGEGVQEVLGLLPLVDVFLPNEPEAQALTGTSDPVRALRGLCEHCRGWVVLKRGAEGVLACGPDDRVLELPAPRVEPRDTTGAGDSLAAGILATLSAGGAMPEAVSTGVQLASAVVGRGSRNRYPSPEEFEAFRAQQPAPPGSGKA